MRRIIIQILAFYILSFPLGSAIAQQAAVPAVISNISEDNNSVGYVYWTGSTVIDAQVGKWELGPTQFGTNSTLLIEIDANDGGIAYFDYLARANDGSTFSISAYSPLLPNIQGVLSGYSPPSNAISNIQKRYSIDLTPYRNKKLIVQFNTSYGFTFQNMTFQARAEISDFQLATCQVAPLKPLTDPDAIAFENGNRINTNSANFNLGTELNCLTNAVANAGGSGTLTSAYRPASYQAHLREVYDKHQLLKNRREPECQTLKTEVEDEFNQHSIIQRPARNSNHSLGNSFDYAINGLTSAQIDSLASSCSLTRPLPVRDRVHFSR